MFSLQQIFQSHSAKGNLSLAQLKAFRSIKSCRTESLGSRLHHCLDCGHSVVLHNSCRNRHCPQCQADKQRKWVDDRLADTLPVSYFHVIFTLPGDLQPIALYNQKL